MKYIKKITAIIMTVQMMISGVVYVVNAAHAELLTYDFSQESYPTFSVSVNSSANHIRTKTYPSGVYGKGSDNKAFMLTESNVSYNTEHSTDIALLAYGKGTSAPDIYENSASSKTETSYETVTIEHSFAFGGDVQRLMLYKRNVLYDKTASKNVNWDGHFIAIHSDGTLTYNNSQYGNAPYEQKVNVSRDLVNKSGWNRIAVTIYPKELKYSVYLNGVKVINKAYLSNKAEYQSTSTCVYRGLTYMMDRNYYKTLSDETITKNGYVGIDDVACYVGEYYSADETKTSLSTEYTVVNKTITATEYTSYENFMNNIITTGAVRVYLDNTLGKMVNTGDFIKDGNYMVIESPDKRSLDYYKIACVADASHVELLTYDFSQESYPTFSVSGNSSANHTRTKTYPSGVHGKGSDNKAFMLTESNVSYNTEHSTDINLLAYGKGTSAPDIYENSSSSKTETSYDTVTIEHSFTFGGDIQKLMLHKRTVLYDKSAEKNINWDGHFITIHKDGTLTYNNSQYGNAPYEQNVSVSSDLINKTGWNRVAVTIYPKELKYSVYLNGVKVLNKAYLSNKTEYQSTSTCVYRGMAYLINRNYYATLSDKTMTKSGYVGVDDVACYLGEYYDVYKTKPMFSTDYIVSNKKITVDKNTSYESFINNILSDGAIRVYTDDTFSEPVSVGMNVESGNYMVVESPDERNLEYYRIKYDGEREIPEILRNVDMETTTEGVSVVLSEGTPVVNTYASSEYKDMLFGKLEGDKAYSISSDSVPYNVTSGGRYLFSYNKFNDTNYGTSEKPVITMEYSIAFNGDVEYVDLYGRARFVSKKDATVSERTVDHWLQLYSSGEVKRVISGTGTVAVNDAVCISNGWNRVAMVLYPDELKYSMYLNGKKVINKEWINASYTDPSAYRYAGMNWIGPSIMYTALKNPDIVRQSTVAVDDVCWYEGEYYDNPQNIINVTVNGFNVDENNNIIIPSSKKVSEVLSSIDTNGGKARIYKDDTFGELLGNDANIGLGNVLVITSPNGLIYEYYNILSGTDVGEFNYTVDGYHTDGKFKTGVFKADVSIKTYESATPTYFLVAAQYKNGALEKLDADVLENIEDTSLDVELNITETENTEIKIMLWNSVGNMIPVREAKTITPFSSQQIETVQEMFPGFTAKAVTFSYDDGPLEDTTLISMFDNAGIKGTFNIISDRFEYSVAPYKNHEVASHSMTHPFFSGYIPDKYDQNANKVLSLDEVKAEISGSKSKLEEMFGCEVSGLAYPYVGLDGRTAAEKQTLKDFMTEIGIEYARVITYRDDFYIPTDWHNWEFTCHHTGMGEYVDEFLALPADGDLKLFSVWGHSHEFKNSTMYNWNYMEGMINRFKEVEDIWKASNIEVCRYSKALDDIVVDYDSNTITNPSSVDIYLYVNGEKVVVPAEGFIIGTGK